MGLDPTAITEVSTFTATVRAPLAGSPVLASDVRAGEQALTNRTRYLLNSGKALPYQNFTSQRVAAAMVLVGTGGAAMWWDPAASCYRVVGGDGGGGAVIKFSYNASDWVDATGIPGGTSDQLVAVSGNYVTAAPYYWASADDGTTVYNHGAGAGTWVSYTLTGVTPQVYGTARQFHDGGNGLTLFWGASNPVVFDEPTIWRARAPAHVPTSTRVTLANAASHLGSIQFLAEGFPDDIVVRVAIFVPGIPGARRLWTNTNDPALTTTWVDAGVAPFTAPVAIAWGQTDGVFLVVESSGKVWTSTNGSTWTLVTTSAFAFIGLAEYGGVWAATAYNSTGENIMAYSTNAGATWTRAPYPLDQTASPPFAPNCIISGDACIAVLATDGTDIMTATSLRNG